MKRKDSKYMLAPPSRRPLRIYASDPMLARTPGNRITIEIPNEPLRPGPIGSRFEVIDYDGAQGEKGWFYHPVDLDHPDILMQNGLEPTESDPRFHQQMVYAVAMRTLENFERALGRRLEFRKRLQDRSQKNCKKLRLIPHAFIGANAYFDSDLNAILFGYFCADREDPGPNLPGQVVFTCLSHDIIVHELTHAIVDKLHPYSLEPTNPDVLAFHEAMADIVALFQHFTFQDFLRDQIQKTRSDIRAGELLVSLARQFGYATGNNQALRSAIGRPEQHLSPLVTEAHERGSILVAAVFDAFFNTYEKRIRDLIRIATGGTGNLPAGDLHPDLVNRIAGEASRTAQSVLTMCIRAFDYLPPVDITFGDFLRAMITADFELNPTDESGLRGEMISAFRARRIYPEDVASLAEESLVWDDAGGDIPPLDPAKITWVNQIQLAAAAYSLDPFQENKLNSAGTRSLNFVPDPADYNKVTQDWGSFSSNYEAELKTDLKIGLEAYASTNQAALMLDPNKGIDVKSFTPVFRISQGGQLLTELVFQVLQEDNTFVNELGGIPFRGGTTVIAGTDGRIRYMIAKPLIDPKTSAGSSDPNNSRLKRQKEYLGTIDLGDPQLCYGDPEYLSQRASLRMKIASLHQEGG